jgi:hypothetical protein
VLGAIIHIDVLQSGEYYVSCGPSPTTDGPGRVATKHPLRSQEDLVELLRSKRVPESEIGRALDELATKGSAEIDEGAL